MLKKITLLMIGVLGWSGGIATTAYGCGSTDEGQKGVSNLQIFNKSSGAVGLASVEVVQGDSNYYKKGWTVSPQAKIPYLPPGKTGIVLTCPDQSGISHAEANLLIPSASTEATPVTISMKNVAGKKMTCRVINGPQPANMQCSASLDKLFGGGDCNCTVTN